MALCPVVREITNTCAYRSIAVHRVNRINQFLGGNNKMKPSIEQIKQVAETFKGEYGIVAIRT